jgi:hypothetical protein
VKATPGISADVSCSVVADFAVSGSVVSGSVGAGSVVVDSVELGSAVVDSVVAGSVELGSAVSSWPVEGSASSFSFSPTDSATISLLVPSCGLGALSPPQLTANIKPIKTMASFHQSIPKICLFQPRQLTDVLENSRLRCMNPSEDAPILTVKKPGPKDQALGCPLRGLQWSFPFAAVYWSDAVVE